MASITAVNTILLLGAVLIIAGILSSLLAFRFGGPLLLIFVAIGMLAGEDGPGGLPFDDYRLTYLIGSGALAVILFDGGLRTRLGELRGALGPALTLATAGVLITTALVGVVSVFLLGISWLEGMLLGAIVASTDAAAVFFLVRTGGLQLRKRVTNTLEVESGTNDPMAVFLTLVLVELLLAGRSGPSWDVLGKFAAEAGLGTVIGFGGGWVAAWVLNRVDLPNGLHPLFAASGAVLIFATAALVGGSGFLAAYVAGLVLGNRPLRAFASIAGFHDTLTWLCQIVMFIVLGLLVTPSRMLSHALVALAIAAFLMFVARPVAAWACLALFRFELRETVFVAWVGLRGAVSIFLAAVPVLVGLPRGELFFNVAFIVVLASLLVQGWTIVPAARWLGLAVPRQSAPVRRVELDLPGQLEYEMVGFPVYADSAVLKRGPLPRWVRPILVVRDEAILPPAEAGPLRAGDYAYFLAPPERAARLDQLFGHAEEGRSLLEGGFPLAGDTPVASLGDLYGLTIEDDERSLTISDLFAKRFDDRPELGDRIALGETTLLAAVDIEEDRVTRVTLLVEDSGVLAAPPAPAPKTWLGRVARMFTGR
jgi:potassium/hydrogen antiporter